MTPCGPSGAALTLRSGRSLWAACRADGTLRSSRASRTLRACLSPVPLRPLRALRTLRPCRSPKSRWSDRAGRAIVGRRSNLTLLALSAHRPCYTLRALLALVPDTCRKHKESHEEEEGDPKTAPPGAARLHVIRIDYPHGKRTFLKEFFRCQDYYSQLPVSRNLRGSFRPHLDIPCPPFPIPRAYAVAAPARAPPARAASQPRIIPRAVGTGLPHPAAPSPHAVGVGPPRLRRGTPALYPFPSLRRRIHTRPISPSPASNTNASGREPCPHVPGPVGSAVGVHRRPHRRRRRHHDHPRRRRRRHYASTSDVGSGVAVGVRRVPSAPASAYSSAPALACPPAPAYPSGSGVVRRPPATGVSTGTGVFGTGTGVVRRLRRQRRECQVETVKESSGPGH